MKAGPFEIDESTPSIIRASDLRARVIGVTEASS
jgi:hypothetical protein